MIESGEGIDDDCTSIDIYIEPPDCSEHTDEDSADKDGTVNNFCRNQLRANCTVQMKSLNGGKKSPFEDDEEDYNSSVDKEYQPGPSTSPSHSSLASSSDSDSSSTLPKEQPPKKT